MRMRITGYAPAVTLAVMSALVTLNAQGPAGTTVQASTASQSPSRSNLKFEVASIKLNRDTGGSVAVAAGSASRPGNYFRSTSSVRALILQAFQIPFVRQLGGPDWIREDTYTINAKIPDDVERTPETVQVMLRALLVDRFNLVFREENREIPVYALVPARADKKLGPKIQVSTCPPRGSSGAPTVPVNQAGLVWERGPRCGQIGSGPMGGGSFAVLGGFPIERLTDLLQYGLGRPVVDDTGLTGDYVVELTYSGQAGPGADGPSIFTAIQEQLGLKLESQRRSMKVLAIDSLQRPTED